MTDCWNESEVDCITSRASRWARKRECLSLPGVKVLIPKIHMQKNTHTFRKYIFRIIKFLKKRMVVARSRISTHLFSAKCAFPEVRSCTASISYAMGSEWAPGAKLPVLTLYLEWKSCRLSSHAASQLWAEALSALCNITWAKAQWLSTIILLKPAHFKARAQILSSSDLDLYILKSLYRI